MSQQQKIANSIATKTKLSDKEIKNAHKHWSAINFDSIFKNLSISKQANAEFVNSSDSNNDSGIYVKNYKEKIEDSILLNLKDVGELWVKQLKDTKVMRKWYGYGMLGLLIGQVIFFAVILTILLWSNKTSNLAQISFASYTVGLITQLIFIPKVIAEHLFPKKQANQLNKILTLAIEHSRNKQESIAANNVIQNEKINPLEDNTTK